MTLVERGATGAALILAIALLRAAVGQMLPRRVFGALWWAAVLRLLLPWELSSQLSVYNLYFAARQPAAALPANGAAAVRLLPGTGSPVFEAPETLPSALLPAVSAGAAVWLAGTLLMAGWFAVSYLRCRRNFQTCLPVDEVASPCLCPGIRPDFRTFDLWPLPAGHSSAQRAGLGG